MQAAPPIQAVMDTSQGQGRMNLTPHQAWWVAGFMLAGVIGLAAIWVIFRKHTEL